MHPAKTQISLGIHPAWSESSVCAQWVAKDPRFLHADSEDSDQTGRIRRLIRVFTGCIVTLLVLSCCGFMDIGQRVPQKTIFKGFYHMSRNMTKPTKWLRPAKTQISLGIHPVWSESSLCTQWVAKGPRFLHADSKDCSDWADAQADLSLCWTHTHFVGFVMLRFHGHRPKGSTEDDF